jgi:metal-dependent amidase/aminoacylase/carboxypeptidase family protein
VASAHAALAPWEGQNALDAAVSAYTSVSMLRQQIRPTHRVHGTIKGKDWTANGMYLLTLSELIRLRGSSHS